VNILFIMTDSLIPQFTGPYGDPYGSTPTLDALARRGVVFENSYCNSPLCAPSRASMVTGRYVSQIGALDNANEFSSEWPTIGHAMAAGGLEPVIAGKMHFVGHDQLHGFAQRLALETDYSTRYDPRFFTMAWSWEQESKGNPIGKHTMAPSYVRSEAWEYYPEHFLRDDETHRQSLAYLTQKTKTGEPFFLCASYHAPHNPFWIADDMKAPFRGKKLPIPLLKPGEDLVHGPMDRWLNTFHWVPEIADTLNKPDNLQWMYETYYGMVYDLDRRIAELLSLLEGAGVLDDTAVVVASDHGDMLGDRGMVQKRYFYERSVRTPLIFALPAKWRQGARVDGSVSLLDLFPTFCDMVGVEAPRDLPGQSLLPSLTGNAEPDPRTIYGEYHGEGVHAPCFMAVEGRLKYIYVHGFEERLYNLDADPQERVNLALSADWSSETIRMRTKLLAQFDPDAIGKAAIAGQRSRRAIYDYSKASGDLDRYVDTSQFASLGQIKEKAL